VYDRAEIEKIFERILQKAEEHGVVYVNDDEDDVGRPKVVTAAEKLQAINSEIAVEPVVARLGQGNAVTLLAGSDLVLDGTDNDGARCLINEVCVKQGIPWVFAAVDESYGLTMTIVPGQGPCFYCVFGEPLSSCMTPCQHKAVLGRIRRRGET